MQTAEATYRRPHPLMEQYRASNREWWKTCRQFGRASRAETLQGRVMAHYHIHKHTGARGLQLRALINRLALIIEGVLP